jgi:uncharacterized protein YecT (DUF1311 family)
MRALFPPALAVLVAGLPAAADPLLECNEGQATETEIAACIAETEARVAAALDAALGFALATASDLDEISATEAALPALDAAQAAWESYRDAHCGFIGEVFGGGTDAGLAEAACRIDLGRARAAALLAAAR